MPDVDAAVREAAARLSEAGVPSARHDAEQLVAFVAGCVPSRLATLPPLSGDQAARLAVLVRRRAAREPLQHLLGTVGFRYLDLAVGPGVFVPRPETEVVAGFAIERARDAGPAPVCVDLCSGTGAIALSIAHEVPRARVHAVEVDADAFTWLQRNATARRQAGDAAVELHRADARDALPALDGTVDVVVSNPPYVADHEMASVDPEVRDHDPRVALIAAGDGLAVIRDVASAAMRLLRPGGWVVVEHSDRQGRSAPAVLSDAGFLDVADHADLTGRPRVAVGRRP
jgi:release factor glutamine methyltransferase